MNIKRTGDYALLCKIETPKRNKIYINKTEFKSKNLIPAYVIKLNQ